MRRCLLLVFVLLTLPGTAFAQATAIDRAAEALRRDPLYVDPAAERTVTDAEADRIRDAIRQSGVPIFIAVLPEAAIEEVGDADRVPAALADAVGLAGTYAAVAGNSFRAAGPAADIATAAFQAKRDAGTAAVLLEFVQRVGDPGGVDPASPAPDGGGGGMSLGPLVLLGAGGAGLYLWSRKRRQETARRTAQEEAADRQFLHAELSVLADDVMRLEPEVALHPEARADYDAAVSRYRAASAALDYADEPVDLERVRRVVDEARYTMDRVRARLDGREPPPPPDELRRPGSRNEPALDVDDRGEVVYAGYGGPFYGGGWFGGGGGLFTGLLLGSMMGGGWFGGGWGGGHADGGGWGDSGGGGWGGGDVGGGDWGGGDIGGGDW